MSPRFVAGGRRPTTAQAALALSAVALLIALAALSGGVPAPWGQALRFVLGTAALCAAALLIVGLARGGGRSASDELRKLR